jgi:nicotinate-nucleotide pyrophosphorylase (carboxylating)
MTHDLRDAIFASLDHRSFTAQVRVVEAGLVSGVELARCKVEALGCRVTDSVADGETATPDRAVLTFSGSAKAIAIAEDCVPGAIAKLSGIARAARRAKELAGERVRVVSGAAKKLPEEIKAQVRRAVHVGGGSGRIVDGPFIYLDKNYVRMFGGVRQALTAVAHMRGHARVIQLRGQLADLADEAKAALDLGAEVLMVDTGRLDDLDRVAAQVRAAGCRERTAIAFAGDIALADIPLIVTHDVDILDVGRAVIDAPMVDVKLDVTAAEQA